MSKFTERSTAPIENTTIVNQLSHRTFRRFTDERLTDEQVDTLVEVARRTATSSFLQQTTILHITDPQVRETIGTASGDGPTPAAPRASDRRARRPLSPPTL